MQVENSNLTILIEPGLVPHYKVHIVPWYHGGVQEDEREQQQHSGCGRAWKPMVLPLAWEGKGKLEATMVKVE